VPLFAVSIAVPLDQIEQHLEARDRILVGIDLRIASARCFLGFASFPRLGAMLNVIVRQHSYEQPERDNRIKPLLAQRPPNDVDFGKVHLSSIGQIGESPSGIRYNIDRCLRPFTFLAQERPRRPALR
jgi:hypothetical protein